MGYIFIGLYVVLISIATIFMKSTLKNIDPYQLNFLMGIGMLISGAIALFFANRTFRMPVKDLPVGITIGTLMAVGSLFYTLALNELPAGLASVLAGAYVAAVVILSWIFLKESMDALKIAGLAITFVGILLLSYKTA